MRHILIFTISLLLFSSPLLGQLKMPSKVIQIGLEELKVCEGLTAKDSEGFLWYGVNDSNEHMGLFYEVMVTIANHLNVKLVASHVNERSGSACRNGNYDIQHMFGWGGSEKDISFQARRWLNKNDIDSRDYILLSFWDNKKYKTKWFYLLSKNSAFYKDKQKYYNLAMINKLIPDNKWSNIWKTKWNKRELHTKNVYESIQERTIAEITKEHGDTIKSCWIKNNEFIKFPNDGSKPYGSGVAYLLSLTNILGLNLIIEQDTIKNCMKKMENGQLDIMTNISSKENRRSYIHLNSYCNPFCIDKKPYFGVSQESKFYPAFYEIVKYLPTESEIKKFDSTNWANAKQHDWEGYKKEEFKSAGVKSTKIIKNCDEYIIRKNSCVGGPLPGYIKEKYPNLKRKSWSSSVKIFKRFSCAKNIEYAKKCNKDKEYIISKSVKKQPADVNEIFLPDSTLSDNQIIYSGISTSLTKDDKSNYGSEPRAERKITFKRIGNSLKGYFSDGGYFDGPAKLMNNVLVFPLNLETKRGLLKGEMYIYPSKDWSTLTGYWYLLWNQGRSRSGKYLCWGSLGNPCTVKIQRWELKSEDREMSKIWAGQLKETKKNIMLPGTCKPLEMMRAGYNKNRRDFTNLKCNFKNRILQGLSGFRGQIFLVQILVIHFYLSVEVLLGQNLIKQSLLDL